MPNYIYTLKTQNTIPRPCRQGTLDPPALPIKSSQLLSKHAFDPAGQNGTHYYAQDFKRGCCRHVVKEKKEREKHLRSLPNQDG